LVLNVPAVIEDLQDLGAGVVREIQARDSTGSFVSASPTGSSKPTSAAASTTTVAPIKKNDKAKQVVQDEDEDEDEDEEDEDEDEDDEDEDDEEDEDADDE
jgi:hypothetical protein